MQAIGLVSFNESFQHFDDGSGCVGRVRCRGGGEVCIKDVRISWTVGNDVDTVADGGSDGFEVVMFSQHDAVGLQHQRIAIVAVGFGKRAVDGDGFAAAFQR
jgi:hypothetical protein